jgi:hypothetical protein
VRNRFGILGELFGFLGRSKRWWMIPIVTVLIVFGALLFLASSTPLGPFIYSLF